MGSTLVRVALAVVLTIVVLWLLFVVALVVLRPRGMSLGEAKRLVPDIARTLRRLAKDDTVPRRVRRRVWFLVAYLALPIDLVPDFIPVLGYADDAIIAALVLRSIVRSAGRDALERHWSGSAAGLEVVRRLAGLREAG